MEQRRLRLGDIVDDYCTRERRVTNHAVVAMVEEDVKQTRCTTCDTEHPYKGGHGPRRRKKDATGALYKEVLAGITDSSEPAPVLAVAAPVPAPVVRQPEAAVTLHAAANGGATNGGTPQNAAPPVVQPEPQAPEVQLPVEDGPVHRPLIRATLPRLEGHKEVRQATDFTIRQSNGRGANFQGNNHQRGGGGDPRIRPRGQGQQGQGQGQPANRPPGGGRFAGARPGNPSRSAAGRPPGGGGGFRTGQAQRPRGNGGAPGGSGGGRKRSR